MTPDETMISPITTAPTPVAEPGRVDSRIAGSGSE